MEKNQETTYYRTVKASERQRGPNAQGEYHAFMRHENDDVDDKLTEDIVFCFEGGKWDVEGWKIVKWLEPIPDAEAQAEWEFVKIMQENYNAAKRGEESAFSGKTKKEAVLEVYEDLLEIIKGLPLKRTGSVEGFLKSIDALKEPDAERLRDALEKIVKDVSAVIPERIPVDDKLLVLLYNVKWTAQQALSAVGDGNDYEQSDSAIEAEREDWEEKQQQGIFEIFEWLLGYNDFPERQDGEGAYYWRTHLREKLKTIGFDIERLPPQPINK